MVTAPTPYPLSCPPLLGYVHTAPDSETKSRRKCTGRASVHTGNAVFEAVSAAEPLCGTVLLRSAVESGERSVSDRFLRHSESSLNTFIGAEIATEPGFVKLSFQIKRERCKLYNR